MDKVYIKSFLLNQRKISMKIKLVFEKVIVGDSLLYKLKEFDCYVVKQLPDLYFKETPYVYKAVTKELVVKGKNFEYSIPIDFPITINTKDTIIETCKIAGKRLKKINDEIRKNWYGIEIFEI
jgi:hypothetical protein